MIEIKLIPLADCAASMRGGKAPARNTLKAWMAKDRIQPRPVRVGAGWYRSPDGQYVDPNQELLERIHMRR